MTAIEVRFGQGSRGDDAWPTEDSYTAGETLPDQPGTGGVLTFTFSSPVDLIWVMGMDPTDAERVVRAEPFGGTPTAALGIPCLDRTQQPITIRTASVKVFAPSGVVVSVWGYRYA